MFIGDTNYSSTYIESMRDGYLPYTNTKHRYVRDADDILSVVQYMRERHGRQSVKRVLGHFMGSVGCEYCREEAGV